MYKIDDEFRPRGRVFMKATRESQQQSSTSSGGEPNLNVVSVPIRKSSLKKGPPITTSLDDRRIQFQHEVKHEKTIEALITEYPPGDDYRPPGSRSYSSDRQTKRYESHTSSSSPQRIQAVPSSSSLNDVSREVIHYATNNNDNGYDVTDNVQAITRNKRTSTEVLGSSFESKKHSQRATDGHRRITTHIVRKVTTLSRAEENAQSQNLVHTAQNKTTEIGYMTTQAIEPKKQKV